MKEDMGLENMGLENMGLENAALEEMALEEMTLEEMLSQIEGIIGKLQQRDISLEESFSLYQQGIERLKLCNEKIDAVEKRLLILNEEGQLV